MHRYLHHIQNFFFNWDHYIPRWFRILVSSFLVFSLLVLIWRMWVNYEAEYHALPMVLEDYWALNVFTAIGLSYANWMCEALKWKLYLRKVVVISLGTAIKAVLYGISLGLVSPNRIGDLTGRSIILPKQYRKEGGTATVFCSISQNSITFFLGGMACLLIIQNEELTEGFENIFITSGFIGIGLSIFFICSLFFSKQTTRLIERLKFNAIHTYLYSIVQRMDTIVHVQNMLLSLARYSIFILQFYLLINIFYPISISICFLGMAITYLFNTIIPSNQIVEFGIRTSIPVWILSFYSVPPHFAALASLLLWVINLGFPAFMGLFLKETRFGKQEADID